MFRYVALLVCVACTLTAQSQQTSAPGSRYRIAGTVVNSVNGQPIANVSVAIAPTVQGMERDIARSGLTGSDGRFSFDDLVRGKYSLMATSRGFTLQSYEHHDAYATAIATGPAIDSEHLVFRLEPDAAVEGQVTDENNEPIQNAMVRLFQTTVEAGQQTTSPVSATQTDDQGDYLIGHLAPGKYYLAVSARPWYAQDTRANAKVANDPQAAQDAAALDVTYPLTFYPDSADSSGATALAVAAGDRVTADMVLRATPSLHLRIHTGATGETPMLGGMTFPRISERVFDGYMDPVFNAPISWIGPGTIQVSGLAPGHYVIEMPASSYPGEKSTSRGWYREIDLTGDLDLNAADEPAFANVSGLIAFPGESRVPKGVSIRLSNPDTDGHFRSDVSSNGEFDFSSHNVRPGRYVVALESGDGLFLTQVVAKGAKISGRTIEIPAGGSVRITGIAARGAARVDGTVLGNGQPFVGAMVVLVPQDPANNVPLFRRDQSDSDGTFTLPNVVPGQYTVIAIANGWELEWANPKVLQPYLKNGAAVDVPPDGKLQVKVEVQ